MITSLCPGISDCIQTHSSRKLSGKSPNSKCVFKAHYLHSFHLFNIYCPNLPQLLLTLYFQVPKIAVPLNTTKYNPSLDDNLTLISSFNKFPYPTQAELSWLTAASKHPEEQIKVWFTTQRLKQGISWSPEEVAVSHHFLAIITGKVWDGVLHWNSMIIIHLSG